MMKGKIGVTGVLSIVGFALTIIEGIVSRKVDERKMRETVAALVKAELTKN